MKNEIMEDSDAVVSEHQDYIYAPIGVKAYEGNKVVDEKFVDLIEQCMDWMERNIPLDTPGVQSFLQESEGSLVFYHNSLGRILRNEVLWSSELRDEDESTIRGIHIDDISMRVIAQFWRKHQDKIVGKVEPMSFQYQRELDELMKSITRP